MRKPDPYPILESRIRTGVYPAGAWLASERELAMELGVHREVIRRAVARLSEGGFLECRPGHRPIVRRVANGAVWHNAVALLMGNEPLFRAFQQVMRGCEHELGAASYRLVFMDTLGRDDDTTRELEGRALDSLIEHPVAGLIVWCQDPVASSQKLDRLRSAGTHIVAIDRVIPNLETDFVGVDNFHAARYAAEHLWELGHRRMGLITLSEKVSAVMDRESGFRSALSRFGMPFDEKNLYRLSPMPANRPEEFAAITKKIFEREDRPTAVFAVNDIVAWRLLQSITAAGYRVPEDMAVVGFDDIESRAMHAPVITTIRQSYEAIGRYAADLLLQRLKAPNSPLRHVLLDTSLVVRASTVAGTEAIGSAFRTTWVPGGPNETIANVPLAHPNAS